MSPTAHTQANFILTFNWGEQTFALPLHCVVRVEQAVALTPLPGAPEHVLGLLNNHGQLLPVLDLRPSLHLPGGKLAFRDQLIICRNEKRSLVLVVDRVLGVSSYHLEVKTSSLLKAALRIHSLVQLGPDLILLTTPERLLEVESVQELEELLTVWQGAAPQAGPLPQDSKL